MPTFCEIYCQKHRCTPAQFQQRLFWRGLYPHTRLLVPLLSAFNRNFFVADRALIRSVAQAVTMSGVRDDVRDYFWDSNNCGWLRRSANLRVSGQRIKELARGYLPEGAPVAVAVVASGADADGSASTFEVPRAHR